MSKNYVIVVENGTPVVNEISLEQLKAIKVILNTTMVEESTTKYNPSPEMRDYEIIWNQPVKAENGTYVLSLAENIPYHVFSLLKAEINPLTYERGKGFNFKDKKSLNTAMKISSIRATKEAPKRRSHK